MPQLSRLWIPSVAAGSGDRHPRKPSALLASPRVEPGHRWLSSRPVSRLHPRSTRRLGPMVVAVGLLLITVAPVMAAGWRPKAGPVVPASATAPAKDAPAQPVAPGPDDIPPADPPATASPAEDVAADARPTADRPAKAPAAAEQIAPAASATPPQTTKPRAAAAAAGPAATPRPACISCGSTCQLLPFCRCEPATRKKPRTIYESKCELVCEPGVGLFGHHHSQRRGGCTDCGPGCGPSRICMKKTLIKTVKEDEVCRIKREVGYICRCCAGACGGCEAPGCEAKPSRSRPALLDWRPFGWLETFWK